jgi:hypothetical protein
MGGCSDAAEHAGDDGTIPILSRRKREQALPPPLLHLLESASLFLIGAVLFALMLAAAAAAYYARVGIERRTESSGTSRRNTDYDGYIVSAVLGLLALLLGFTFSLAIGRFEERRELVITESNAISTAYLRTQLLEAPHRGRLSQLLVEYLDNKITLAKTDYSEVKPLLAKDDALLTSIWAATAAAFDSVKKTPFSNALIDSINKMIDLDASRRAARTSPIPTEVFVVLLIYLIGAAGVLGYVLAGGRGLLVAGFLLVLFSMSLLLILDLDRPVSGLIHEDQRPLELLRASIQSRPPTVFDQWRNDPLRH